MIIDWLFPRNRGKTPPLNPGPSSVGAMAYADGVNWNPIGDGTSGWIMWTGTRWSKIGRAAWGDFTASSVYTGWASFTAQQIKYSVVGDICFVFYQIDGTSNSGGASFTVPFTSITFLEALNRSADNGTFTAAGLIQVGANSSVINLYSSVPGSAWTASGRKYVSGEFFYRIA